MFPADFGALVEALIMTNLGAPAERGSVSVYITKSGVDDLLPSGKYHELAELAIAFLIAFDRHFAVLLHDLPAKRKIIFHAQCRRAVGEIVSGKTKGVSMHAASVRNAFLLLQSKLSQIASKLAEKASISNPPCWGNAAAPDAGVSRFCRCGCRIWHEWRCLTAAAVDGPGICR